MPTTSSHSPYRGKVPSREDVERALESSLPTFIEKRRWFAAKDEAVPRLTLAALSPIDSGDFAFAELQATTSKGTESYLLPLTLVRADQAAESEPAIVARDFDVNAPGEALVDATYTLNFVHASLELMRAGATLRTANGDEIRYLPTGAFADCRPGASDQAQPSVKWLSGEQSNTSVVVDNRLVLKVIRRISSGVHPEAEMCCYLAKRKFANACALFGEVVWVSNDGEPRTLCIVQEFIPNDGDAWRYAVEFLKRMTASRIPADGNGVYGDVEEEREVAQYSAFAALIGRRLAELHVALALPGDPDDGAFSPELAEPEMITSWIRSVSDQVERALDILESRSDLHIGEEGLTQSVLDQRDLLLDAIDASVPRSSQVLCTRIHGDFHLGQILKTRNDVFIIDFEGEPSKPLKERRAKASPIRDVAGLLRSLSYASACVLRSDERTPIEQQRVSAALDRCRRAAETAFLTGYEEVMVSTSAPLTSDLETFNALLNLFLLDKAAYEVCYEAANRPEWVDVPLSGFASIAKRQFIDS
jgi:maltose alpha-D-glucosyltransferase / alpha-amylase